VSRPATVRAIGAASDHPMVKEQQIAWFGDLGMADVGRVGGKNASLGEMLRGLSAVGVRVPDGFATTAEAYRGFVESNNLPPATHEVMDAYRSGALSLQQAGDRLRGMILAGAMPGPLVRDIRGAYRELSLRYGQPDIPVAVRSSATAEDLPDASFAGQQETFLNVQGEDDVLEACRRCYASLFTDRAISYRDLKHFDQFDVALSVGIQAMVRSDVGSSGVMFSIDTETGFPDAVVISAAWGLGETVVQGMVEPDRYIVYKPLLTVPETYPILDKSRGAKERKLILGTPGREQTRLVDTSVEERRELVLTDSDILHLARWAVMVESHYGRPMDMEWARDGVTGELFMVQARPETVQSSRSRTKFTLDRLTEQPPEPLLRGAAVGDSIASGLVCRISSPTDITGFVPGSVLVTGRTDPDWVPVMKQAAGIITDHGGSTSHAAIVSRELGVPAVVGTGRATEVLRDGQTVTLDCAEGDVGSVYAGALGFESETVDLAGIPQTRTAVMVNIASPASAFRWWRLPAAGVGLARMEFIISNLIRVHPMALAHPERVNGPERAAMEEAVEGFDSPREFFVQTLAAGIAKLAAPYYPRPVIVRLSDFKTNEYAGLIGGSVFEPTEENPMLGFRGASRYYDPRYRDGFELECRALRRARLWLGFRNIVIMVPFCRTPGEADRVLEVMAANGLVRGEDGLKIYMMCEIPANVVRAPEFATRFDGFSIGSNDLTQLVLGVDRDSEILAPLFDERDPAVVAMIRSVIRDAHAAGTKIGICGQAPSTYPDYCSFLVEAGIDSISLNPDTFLKTLPSVARAEEGEAPALGDSH
jgi:pyruvate, water dikinase